MNAARECGRHGNFHGFQISPGVAVVADGPAAPLIGKPVRLTCAQPDGHPGPHRDADGNEWIISEETITEVQAIQDYDDERDRRERQEQEARRELARVLHRLTPLSVDLAECEGMAEALWAIGYRKL